MHGVKALIIAATYLLASGNLRAAEIMIGLFHGKNVKSFVFSVVEGEYILYGNNQRICTAGKGTIFHIELSGSGMTVQGMQQSFGKFNILDIKGISATNVFLIKPVVPSLAQKESDDDLMVSVADNGLLMINRLDLEKYITGTVESEGGPNASLEFYKAQAVLVQTYARKNYYRHAHEGFNLCDNEHCQAYKGKSRMNKDIYTATRATLNQILVDGQGEPVTTAYHACCGGITASAATIWNRDLPHLIPVKDPFCSASTHSNWSRTLTAGDWQSYVKSKGLTDFSFSGSAASSLNRQKFTGNGRVKLPLTVIREDLKLKSSYFSMSQQNGQVVIKGHGYGHGLGMCQEGAMEMSRVGYTYVDILMFYFYGLKLISL